MPIGPGTVKLLILPKVGVEEPVTSAVIVEPTIRLTTTVLPAPALPIPSVILIIEPVEVVIYKLGVVSNPVIIIVHDDVLVVIEVIRVPAHMLPADLIKLIFPKVGLTPPNDRKLSVLIEVLDTYVVFVLAILPMYDIGVTIDPTEKFAAPATPLTVTSHGPISAGVEYDKGAGVCTGTVNVPVVVNVCIVYNPDVLVVPPVQFPILVNRLIITTPEPPAPEPPLHPPFGAQYEPPPPPPPVFGTAFGVP